MGRSKYAEVLLFNLSKLSPSKKICIQFQIERELLSDDAEAMAQLDWLWSNKLKKRNSHRRIDDAVGVAVKDEAGDGEGETVAELSQQLDKLESHSKSKPINR